MVIARVGAPHGVQGEISAIIQTDFPERFSQLKGVYVGSAGQPAAYYRVESTRPAKDRVLIKLAGIDSVEAAGSLRNASISVPADEAVVLPPDQFFWRDIIGLQVYCSDGRQLGQIVDILRTGSNDVYVVRHGEGEVLIPAIEDVVKQIDIAGKKMVIEPLPGMLE